MGNRPLSQNTKKKIDPISSRQGAITKILPTDSREWILQNL